nr:hypothetical protein [Streptomyces sp. F-1]
MAGPRELRSLDDVRAAANGDPLLLWAAGDLLGGARAFFLGEAAAVAAPGLSGRDRLAVTGPADAAAALIRALLPRLGPTFRPLGDESLVRDLVTRLPGLEFVDAFGWMQTDTATGHGDAAAWLTPSDDQDVARLLDEAFPNSHARPGRPGVRRWAGAREASGALSACAADAWSAPGVGFLAGVAAAERARTRRRHGRVRPRPGPPGRRPRHGRPDGRRLEHRRRPSLPPPRTVLAAARRRPDRGSGPPPLRDRPTAGRLVCSSPGSVQEMFNERLDPGQGGTAGALGSDTLPAVIPLRVRMITARCRS